MALCRSRFSRSHSAQRLEVLRCLEQVKQTTWILTSLEVSLQQFLFILNCRTNIFYLFYT